MLIHTTHFLFLKKLKIKINTQIETQKLLVFSVYVFVCMYKLKPKSYCVSILNLVVERGEGAGEGGGGCQGRAGGFNP